VQAAAVGFAGVVAWFPGAGLGVFVGACGPGAGDAGGRRLWGAVGLRKNDPLRRSSNRRRRFCSSSPKWALGKLFVDVGELIVRPREEAGEDNGDFFGHFPCPPETFETGMTGADHAA